MIPLLSQGASIDSLLIWRARLIGIESYKSLIAKFLLNFNSARKQNPMCFWANRISELAFDSRVDAVELLRNHSVAPLMLAQFTSIRRAELEKSFLFGHNANAIIGWDAPVWAACTECVEEDLRHEGVAHWKVTHQLPLVDYCPQHMIMLWRRCGECGVEIGKPPTLNLPSDPCPICGSMNRELRPLQILPGRAALIQLYTSVLKGSGPDLDPDWWKAKSVILRAKTMEMINYRIQDFYGLKSARELENLLRIKIKPCEIIRIIESGRVKYSGALVHAVRAYIDHFDNI